VLTIHKGHIQYWSTRLSCRTDNIGYCERRGTTSNYQTGKCGDRRFTYHPFILDDLLKGIGSRRWHESLSWPYHWSWWYKREEPRPKYVSSWFQTKSLSSIQAIMLIDLEDQWRTFQKISNLIVIPDGICGALFTPRICRSFRLIRY